MVAAEATIATDEPALKPALAPVRAAIAKWHKDKGGQGACLVVANDGVILSIECDSFYTTGNGGVRHGEDTFFNFHRRGDRFVELSPTAMMPGITGKLHQAINGRCGWGAAAPDAGYDITPLPDAIQIEVGPGPVWSTMCQLPYREHPLLFGCGALSSLAGHSARQPPTNNKPSALGFVSHRHPRADLLVWPHFMGVDERGDKAARAVNAAVEKVVAPLKIAAESHAIVECEVTLSSIEVVGIACTGSTAKTISDGLSFRLDGPPYAITPKEVLGGRRNAIDVVTKACTDRYRKRPGMKDWEEFLEARPKWKAVDLASFSLTETGVMFHVELGLRYKGESKPHSRREVCHVPYRSLGVNPIKLSKRPAQAAP